MLRALTVMAIASGLSASAVAPARADSGPVIVIPSRPGVPVIINGRDASWAVVEGDWGLARPGHGVVTVIGGARVLPNPVYRDRNAYHPRYGRAPERGRNEVEPSADRPLPDPAESYDRSWSTSSDAPVPATITDPATFPNYMNGGINGALINNNSNNRNNGNTNSGNSQNTNYNNSNINNTNSNNSTTTNTNSNNTTNASTNTNNNTNSNNTTNTNSHNNSSRNMIGNNGSRRHYRR
jgi:hypothetical protein